MIAIDSLYLVTEIVTHTSFIGAIMTAMIQSPKLNF